MRRGPFVWTIENWVHGTPIQIVANVPIGSVAKHVRILPRKPASGILLSGGPIGPNAYDVKIVYDAPDVMGPLVPRAIIGHPEGEANAGPSAEVATCIGGFIHPDDVLGWLLYEVAIAVPEAKS